MLATWPIGTIGGGGRISAGTSGCVNRLVHSVIGGIQSQFLDAEACLGSVGTGGYTLQRAKSLSWPVMASVSVICYFFTFLD